MGVAAEQALGRAREGAPHGELFSHREEGELELACVLRPQVGMGSLSGVPYVAALGACEGLEQLGIAGVGIGWPADVVREDGTRLVAYPAGMDGESYTVDEKVTTIGANAFDNCKNLKKLVIPATVKTIVEPAVQNCGSLVIHVEDKSAAKTYFEAHTNGFSALKIGAEKPGDVNADGEVDNADVILLRRYVAKWKNISIHTDAADVNKDAEVDNADVILLRRFVAGWKNVTLK